MEACFICGELQSNLCQLCGQVHVCINHGQLHSINNYCFPFRIAQHKFKGRILTAVRDVRAGEILFAEKALFTGPAKSSQPICLTCLGPQVPKEKCSHCNFPMCSKECCEAHLKMPECAIIAANLTNDFQAILPLRCLLQKGSHPWQHLQMFTDHCQDRKLTTTWSSDRKSIVQQIREKWHQSQFSQEEIFRVEGILDVNTLELLDFEASESDETTEGKHPRAFYPITSFASHDCVNNTFRTLTKDQVLETRAKMDIAEGEEITLHYAGGLKGRLMRRSLLAEGWFFACQCKRCKSPDELGSHMSTLQCQDCQQGLVMPDCCDILEYHCNFCTAKMTSEQVGKLESELSLLIEDNYASDPVALKSILDQYKHLFHPRHYLILILKWLLMNIYGRHKEWHYALLDPQLVQDKLTFCQEYLQSMDIIDPGLSHNRGRTLWELYSVQAFMTSQKWTKGQLSKENFKQEIRELLSILEQVSRCLMYSHPGSFEHNVYLLSQKAISNTKETLTFIDLMNKA